VTTLVIAVVRRWLRRPDVVVVVLAVPLLSATIWVVGMLHAQTMAAQLDDPLSGTFLDAYRLPRSTGTIFTSGPWLNFAALYLGAVTAGSEFAWGTVRNAVFAPRGRMSFALAHFAFLSILVLAMILAILGLGILLPVAAASVHVFSEVGSVEGPLIASEIVSVSAGAAVWASAGVALATLLRSPVTPILVAVTYSVIEALISPLSVWQGSDVARWIPRLLPGNSVGGLAIELQRHAGTVGAGAQLPDYLASPWSISLLAAASWSLIFAVTTLLVLRSIDITE
jgi:hypothetical protein